jgi:hypothetical protein
VRMVENQMEVEIRDPTVGGKSDEKGGSSELRRALCRSAPELHN